VDDLACVLLDPEATLLWEQHYEEISKLFFVIPYHQALVLFAPLELKTTLNKQHYIWSGTQVFIA